MIMFVLFFPAFNTLGSFISHQCDWLQAAFVHSAPLHLMIVYFFPCVCPFVVFYAWLQNNFLSEAIKADLNPDLWEGPSLIQSCVNTGETSASAWSLFFSTPGKERDCCDLTKERTVREMRVGWGNVAF